MREQSVSSKEQLVNERGSVDDASPRRASRRSDAPEHSLLGEQLIAGVPARIMRPRLVFIACLVALVVFGLLMVYSASAVEALKENGDAMFYLKRQLLFAIVGFAALGIVSTRLVSWEFATTKLTCVLWVVMALFLLAVKFVGSGAGGATRWINLGFFMFQPSEFVKPVLIIAMAVILSDRYEKQSSTATSYAWSVTLVVGLPCALIIFQPDMGTTVIICATMFAMALLAGMSLRFTVGLGASAAVVSGILIKLQPYRLERIAAALDPWSDKFGSGYQATLALMAFTSGGLFGRGIGNSTMKYSYLPEAHNDFILAIIGEELGFVGTVIFFAVFATLIFCGFKIAWRAPRLRDRMIAAGASFMLGAQFFVNALGILGVTPMTGKTLPFISYGGSSIISCLILAALIIRVSVESNPRTVYDSRRASFAVMNDADAVSDHLGRSTAGEPHPRSSTASRGGFSVYDGSRSAAAPASRRASHPSSAPRSRSGETRGGGWRRVNLNSDPADRLRDRSSSSRGNRYDR